ncbi:hypothetical protein TorRG33x02_102220 [Trema orientale]|uniref:Uncharacterized protein n=1 Tax=Trema orientale TaxID=63057 RepID=A0A2P5F7Q9_TREOI|nr:hypothetical protein TorRG33x02_102220 [Trema orientale]
MKAPSSPPFDPRSQKHIQALRPTRGREGKFKPSRPARGYESKSKPLTSLKPLRPKLNPKSSSSPAIHYLDTIPALDTFLVLTLRKVRPCGRHHHGVVALGTHGLLEKGPVNRGLREPSRDPEAIVNEAPEVQIRELLRVFEVCHSLALSPSDTSLCFSPKALELFSQLALGFFTLQDLLISFLLLFRGLVSGILHFLLMALGVLELGIERLRKLGKPLKLPDDLSPKSSY